MTTEKKEREVPICHRLMAAMYTGSDPDCPWPDVDSFGNYARCLGSRCALWVPCCGEEHQLVGQGRCTDTSRNANPWPDPAKEQP